MGTMPPKKVSNADAGDADHVGGNDWDDVAEYFDDTDKTGPVRINTETRFRSGKLKFRDTGNNHNYTHNFSDLAADRAVTWPLLTADDEVAFKAQSQTLTNKTIELEDNTLKLRDFIRVFKDGSTYYAVENNGTVLSSSANPETVFQAAIDAGARDINIKDGTYTFSGGFAGLNITDQDDRYIQMSRNAILQVPAGYASHVFKIEGNCKGVHISGGQLDEAGTPSKLWKGIHLKSTGSSDAIKHCKFDFIQINNCGWMVYLEVTDPNGFINSLEFNNIWGYYPIVGFEWVNSGASSSPFLHNHFYNIDIQADSNTLYGFKNVMTRTPLFIGCEIQDMDSDDTQMEIHSSCADCIIIGGSLNSGGSTGLFTDNGSNTFFMARGTTGLSMGRNALFKGSLTANAGFISQGFTRFEGDISPSQITSDQNDYNPTNLSTSSRLRLDGDSSFRTITGLQGGADGRRLRLDNISANSILLANENTGSSASNRFDFGGHDVPLFPSSSIDIQYDSTSSRWRLSNPESLVTPSSKLGYYYTRHWGSTGSDGVTSTTAASGGTASTITAIAAHPSIVQFTLGTSTTGSGSYGILNSNQMLLGNSWYWKYETIAQIRALSDGTNTYTMRFGFLDSGSAESTDGVFFRYTDSVNSGKWVLVARSNSSETTTNATNTAVAINTWYRLTIIVNPAGTSAEFFQNGVSLGTVGTTIPTGAGRGTGFGGMFLKTAGTADNTVLDVDAITVVGYSNVNQS